MTSESPNKTGAFRNRIFREILHGNYSPGDRLPTERDIARDCGISRITVRRAYAELEENGILERRRGSGTYVAASRGANGNSGKLIALLISVGDPFTLEFIRAMEKEVSGAGGLLALRLTDDSPELEENIAIDLVGNGVNNLVVWPSGRAFRSDTFSRLRLLGANMVFFDRMLPGGYADYVGLDNRDALKQLFLRAGEVKSPLFAGHADTLHDSDLAREAAFMEECEKRGIRGNILRFPADGLPAVPSGVWKKTDAVFAVNDEMAQRFLPILGKRKLFGINGSCDSFVSYRQPMRKFAETAVKLLCRQRDGSDKWRPRQIFIKGEICEKLS